MNCKNCGGWMVGDGYSVPIHCETIDAPMHEPDAEPEYCGANGLATDKPEVVAYYYINKDKPDHRGVSLHHDASCHSTLINTEPLIRLSDYEALQAECEKLVEALESLLDMQDEDCRYDHQGYCQNHNLDHVEDGCRVARAKAALAAYRKPQENHNGRR